MIKLKCDNCKEEFFKKDLILADNNDFYCSECYLEYLEDLEYEHEKNKTYSDLMLFFQDSNKNELDKKLELENKRQCRVCNKIYDISYFPKNGKNKNKIVYRHCCKKCFNQKCMKRRIEND
jgi:hypothetical protein|nr:MAG TPA: zinc-ribbon domain protein [Caudoviricetes sp.]